jgi:alanine racemase
MLLNPVTRRLRINLAALSANYRLFRSSCAGGISAAVVKADAYGLGLAPVSGTLWREGCRDFFVASCEEGVQLRTLFPQARIYVFEGARNETASGLADAGLIPVLNHPGQLEAWKRLGGGGAVAVHLDTGMHRLGFPWDTDVEVFNGIAVELLMTHLACADDPDHPLNALQQQRFAGAGTRFRVRFPGLRLSVGNSAGVLNGVEGDGGMGRPGIGLFGGNPLADGVSPVRPVVTMEGQVLQLRRVPPGESIGYGASHLASREMALAVVGLGYADGLPRLLSNHGEAFCAGRRCPIVGRVSMDLTTVDVSGVSVAPGDWVEFMGEHISVDEVAAWAQTIPYEILTGLGSRHQRIYEETAATG